MIISYSSNQFEVIVRVLSKLFSEFLCQLCFHFFLKHAGEVCIIVLIEEEKLWCSSYYVGHNNNTVTSTLCNGPIRCMDYYFIIIQIVTPLHYRLML